MNWEKYSAYFILTLAVMLLFAPVGYTQDKSRRECNCTPNEESLKSLTQYAPEYKDYQIQMVALPMAVPALSIKIVSRIKYFVGTVGPDSGGIKLTPTVSIGAVPFDKKKKEEAAKLLDRKVRAGISRNITSNAESKYRLLVVSGEGGGIIIGEGGFITAEVFLLDTRTKTLVAYSDDPIGKGSDVDTAIKDLANAVAEKCSEIAIQAK